MNTKTTVQAGSRIHLGFLRLPPHPDAWASAALYIDNPQLTLQAQVTPYPTLKIEGLPPDLSRILEKTLPRLGLDKTKITYTTRSTPPRHHGLGTTTQTLLAAAHAALAAAGQPWNPYQAAKTLGRGRRSEAGVTLYHLGGIVILPSRGLPPPILIHKQPTPHWRVILLIPKTTPGPPEGQVEEKLIQKLPPATPALQEQLEQTMLDLIRALHKDDPHEFNTAACHLDRLNGTYFQPAQGSTIREDLAPLVKKAEQEGICLSQSSWGPTLYTITHQDNVPVVIDELRQLTRETKTKANLLTAKIRGPPKIEVQP